MNKNIIIGVLVVLIIIAGVAFFVNRNETSNMTESDTTSMPENTSATSTSTSDNTGSDISVGVGVTANVTKSFTVTGNNFTFSPATMTVNKGDRVKITFVASEGFHDLVVDGYNVKTKQMPAGQQETIEFTADKAGTFEYYCSVGSHRAMGMKGTLTVK